ncbi:hypothetical protein FOCC_FOCC003901 [Frankliniella occidentalis]|nr:hypothetical protein FOCC_FOCC003901 [Frankliniella occidentalis]
MQMAKDQLQKLVEKREYGKAHIEKLKQKAESFFLKTTSCSRGFITTVLKAKTEYIRKIQDLLKNTEFFLEKTRSDFPLAGYLF